MSTPFSSSCLAWVRTLALLMLGLLAVPLTGCNAPRQTHDLSAVALDTVDAETREALKTELAALTPGDHTDSGAKLATELLARANADAPTSAKARAAQALVINALFQLGANETNSVWHVSSVYPELWYQIGVTFDQADLRMKQLPPDLMTVMVWARTGTTLNRKDQLCAGIQRAADNQSLRDTLRLDDATRARLCSYATSSTERDCSGSILYRQRDATTEDVANSALMIVALPILIIMLVLGGLPNC